MPETKAAAVHLENASAQDGSVSRRSSSNWRDRALKKGGSRTTTPAVTPAATPSKEAADSSTNGAEDSGRSSMMIKPTRKDSGWRNSSASVNDWEQFDAFLGNPETPDAAAKKEAGTSGSK